MQLLFETIKKQYSKFTFFVLAFLQFSHKAWYS